MAARERMAAARRGKGKAKEKAEAGEGNPAAVGEARVEVVVAAKAAPTQKARKGRVAARGKVGQAGLDTQRNCASQTTH